MKKQITKHFMAFFLSLVMIMAMGLTAFANGDTKTGGETAYSLTLKGTAIGHKYQTYQIFQGDLSTKTINGQEVKVLSNVQWGCGVTYKDTDSAADVAKKLGDGDMDIDRLVQNLNLTTPYSETNSTQGTTVINNLAAGYYLVKDEDESLVNKHDSYTKFIVQVVGNTEADIKSDVPTVEKKVKDTNDSKGETSDWQDSADADINDQVEYKITGTLPDNYKDYTKYSYVFTDTMSKGLTYTASTDGKKSFKVTLYNSDDDKDGTNITDHFNEVIAGYAGDDPEYTGGKVITWTEKDSKGLKDIPQITESSKIVITYNATLNKDAKIGAAGNPNKVDLTFSNNPNIGHEGENGKTPEDKNIVFTYKVVVNKVDQDEKPLAGALFTLSKVSLDENGKVKETGDPIKTYVLTGNPDNDPTTFTASGLDDGTYVLKETKTPTGYNTIADQYFTIEATHETTADNPQLTALSGTKLEGSVITFTSEKTTGSLTTNVVNKEGSTLPSTGGRGTTMIYIIGAALVVTAGVVLVMRKKMNSDK